MPHTKPDNEPDNGEPLSSQAYSQRQLIVVVDDSMAEAERQAAKGVSTGKKGRDWPEIVGRVYRSMVLSQLPFANSGLAAVAGEAAEASVEMALGFLKGVFRLREQGLNVQTLARSETTTLIFPPGHPRKGIIYVGHPIMPSIYYTAAQFHRLTFEHKFSEAVEVLMALGATELNVEHVRGWSREFASTLDVPLGTTQVQAGASAGRRKLSGSQILFKASLKGIQNPALPQNLAWYHHEPTWHMIAEGRLRYGLQNFSLTVAYEDDFGVNAGLKLAASKVGLDMGGRFEDHEATVWRIVGKFKESSEVGTHKSRAQAIHEDNGNG